MRKGLARHPLLCAWLAVSWVAMAPPTAMAEPPTPHPNILFIIMDDVGIDQLQTFGYGGATPPATPNITQIADAGIRFRNTWSMPACSTSRAVLFEGRYPMRTNVFAALGPNDLANSMVGPFEMTAPKLLKERDYQSALFGKFHLGLQGNSPFRYAMPRSLGWDYFFGWLDESGDPSSIDTTAGGVGPSGTYSCGYVPGAAAGGADQGACYSPDGTCRVMEGIGPNPPGRACRDGGGIFDPGQSCKTPRPSNIDFTVLSAHYVSPVVINHEDGAVEQVPPTDIRARTYRGIAPVTAAIDWIKRRPSDVPWMASVSFATVHTPLQQPPVSLLPAGSTDTNGLDCANTVQQRILSNQMIEALDTELGRLFVETGLATHGLDGKLLYDPKKTNTMVILVGDNGSLGYMVKLPFDPTRAKGTAYQTGVWVPLVVAGPLVNQPGRDVVHMTNIADIYQLFGEIAGIDVPNRVVRPLDSVAMLPYLTQPGAAEHPQLQFHPDRPQPAARRRAQRSVQLWHQLFAHPRLEERMRGQWRGLVGRGRDRPEHRGHSPAGPDLLLRGRHLAGQPRSAHGHDPAPGRGGDPQRALQAGAQHDQGLRSEHERLCEHTDRSNSTRSTRTSPYRRSTWPMTICSMADIDDHPEENVRIPVDATECDRRKRRHMQRRWQSRPHRRHRGRDRLDTIQPGEWREVELVRLQSGWPDR